MMKKIQEPYLLQFNKIGVSNTGYISVAELDKDIPFELQRIFWTYYTPESISRGGHAHHGTEMVLIAMAGGIEVSTETPGNNKMNFMLNSPDKGLYLPTYCWHTMKYSHNAVQLVLASTPYEASDYIRNYEAFKLIAL